jgi:hypothetical protein
MTLLPSGASDSRADPILEEELVRRVSLQLAQKDSLLPQPRSKISGDLLEWGDHLVGTANGNIN